MGKLGYTSVTLTDLTQTLPVSLTLESNLEKNIQTRTGNLFNPDFSSMETQLGEELLEGVIITPSLFLGQEEIDLEKNEQYINPNFNNKERNSGYLYYEIGDNRYEYGKNIDPHIYVDDKGRLHIKKNLTENITIEAYIEDFEIEAHGYIDPLVSVINPITIILLEEGSSNYQVIITSMDGREHFEDTNASPITLTASLWRGLDEVNAELSYSWNKLSDGESESKTEASITVYRKDIINREYFTCVITDTQTGLSYSASKFIYDFTDTYLCDIAYDKMPLLTDKNTTITLAANVWNKNTLIESSTEGFNLSYDWFAIGSILDENKKPVEVILRDSESENKNSSSYTLDISNIPELQYQDFVVYCKVYQTDSANNTYPIAGGTLNIHYTVQYSVKVTPQTIFVPTSSAGTRTGASSYEFTFQLLDTDSNPLPRDDSQITLVGAQNDGTVISFEGEDGLWNFTGIIDFTESSLWNEEVSSRFYEFTYVYLGQEFTEEINIVKSYAGEQGFSGYTVDLSNSFHAFPGGESKADANEKVTTEISAYYGSTSLEIEEISVAGKNSDTVKIYKISEDDPDIIEINNLKIKAYIKTGKIITVEMTTGEGDSSVTEGDSLSFYIKVKKPDSQETIQILKTFTYIINYYGKSYYLNPSANSIIYSNATGNYEPDSAVGIYVTANYRSENGEVSSYENGKIIYSYNGENWSLLGSSGYVKNYRNYKNVYLRLYGGTADFTNASINLENNEKYLYDRETIPILTSLEGYEFGGENLLRWTKDFPLRNDKWKTTDSVQVLKEDDFGILDFDAAAGQKWRTAKSPKINFLDEYLGKSFCISFYIKVDSLEAFEGTFGPYLVLNSKYEETKRERYGKIFSLFSDGSSNSSITFDRPFEANTWIKVSHVFTIPKDDLDEQRFTVTDAELISWDECKYMSIFFYLESTGKVQIKKPKLEMGTVSTDWSASPFDINYEDISGMNLIKNSSEIIIEKIVNKDSYVNLNNSLEPNTFYTFSYYEPEWEPGSVDKKSNNFRIVIQNYENSLENPLSFELINTFEEEQPRLEKTFQTPADDSSYSFLIYPALESDISSEGKLKLKKVKLEKGTSASSYFLSTEDLGTTISILEQKAVDYVTINTLDGEIEAKISDLKNTISKLDSTYVKIDENKGTIESVARKLIAEHSFSDISDEEGVDPKNNKYYNFFTQLEGRISLEPDATDPYIEISTQKGGESGAIPISSIKITDDTIYFTEKGREVARINGSYLSIKRGIFEEDLKIGKLQVSITDSGVGFLWG